MKFKYRNHVITINDKIVECFTSFVEPTVTERLFDSYVEGFYTEVNKKISDADLAKYTDKELSERMSSCMLEECQVTLEVKDYWDEEFAKGELS